MGRLAGRGLGSRLRRAPDRLQPAMPMGGGAPRPRAFKKWYATKRWRDLREAVFKRDGYECQATGVLLVGEYPAPDSPVCDHIRPHRGDPELFWDPANLQTVSKAYHDSDKQRLEASGALDV